MLSELFNLRVCSDSAIMRLRDDIILGVEADRLHKLDAVMLAIFPEMIVNVAHLKLLLVGMVQCGILSDNTASTTHSTAVANRRSQRLALMDHI